MPPLHRTLASATRFGRSLMERVAKRATEMRNFAAPQTRNESQPDSGGVQEEAPSLGTGPVTRPN